MEDAEQAQGMTTGARMAQTTGRAREEKTAAEAREESMVGDASTEPRAGIPGHSSTAESREEGAMVEIW